MNARTAALCISLLATGASAQGFAGLGQSEDGYALPDPDYRFSFPADHGSHPEFRIEWWYVTANLEDADGTPYGVQWTLFRNALSPQAGAKDQAWMGHAAVSTPEGHLFAERLARGGIGQAGVVTQPFAAFIDEWSLSGSSLSEVTLTAQGEEFHYELELAADRPFVPQGAEGYSVKSEAGQASHYYSQPFYSVSGTLTVPGKSVEVRGQAWLDREWSSQPLTSDQTGWDWISLHLDSGEKLMGYRLRSVSGDSYTVGTWISAAGEPTPLPEGALTMTPVGHTQVAGRSVPTEWAVSLPDSSFTATLKAIYPDSWMGTRIPYWEGPVTVRGSHLGRGYLEMSGY